MEAQVLSEFKRLASAYLKEEGNNTGDAAEYIGQMVEWVEDNKDSIDVKLPSELFDEYSEMLSFYEDDDERADVIDDFEIFVYGNEDDELGEAEDENDDQDDDMDEEQEDNSEDEGPLYTEEDVFDCITDSVIGQMRFSEEFFDYIDYHAFSNLIFQVLVRILDKTDKDEIALAFMADLMRVGYFPEDDNAIPGMINTILEKCQPELAALHMAQIAFDGKASPDLVMAKVDEFLADRN